MKESESAAVVVDTKQRLPEWMRVLNDEELVKFSKYQHSVPKSTLDQFYVNGPTGFAETFLPSCLSANSVTLLGQLPVLVLLLVIFALFSADISPQNLLPPWVLFLCGCVIFWFD